MSAVIFDLDGTLADTAADLIAAANACFEARGWGPLLHPIDDATTAFRGGRKMLKLGFSRVGMDCDDQTMEENYAEFVGFYRANLIQDTKLYPGVASALTDLRSAGFAIGICTNKPEAQAEEVVRRLGIQNHIDSLVGADTLPVRKPDPRPYFEAVDRAGANGRTSLLVGDTETDVATARAAGVPCVLVNFGPEGRGISRLNGDAYLDHLSEITELAIDMIGRPETGR